MKTIYVYVICFILKIPRNLVFYNRNPGETVLRLLLYFRVEANNFVFYSFNLFLGLSLFSLATRYFKAY